MARSRIIPLIRAVSLLIVVCLVGVDAKARHGGTETPEDQVYFADPILKTLVESQLGVTDPTVADGGVSGRAPRSTVPSDSSPI